MRDDHVAVLAAAEGAGAEIAWYIVYALCLILMVAPFALWYAGVRTPRAERRAARAARMAAATPEVTTAATDIARDDHAPNEERTELAS